MKIAITTVGVLLIIMIASLVLTFRSFRLAGIILIVAILSVGLGIGSLALFNYPFGFMALLGIIGLLGVVVNDSIVVLCSLTNDPLLLDSSGCWPPLAITIVGGLRGETLIALYFVPSAYLLLKRRFQENCSSSI